MWKWRDSCAFIISLYSITNKTDLSYKKRYLSKVGSEDSRFRLTVIFVQMNKMGVSICLISN